MKKLFTLIFISFLVFISIDVFAYDLNKDDKIYVGGQSIGIKINNGVSVVGTYGIYKDGTLIKPWEQANIIEGDKIISLNNIEIKDIKDLLKALKNSNGEEVDISLMRKGKLFKSTIQPILIDGSYSLGLYVKDSILGVGTLTYYIDQINTFGSLGHQITEDNIYSGNIYEATVTEIVKPKRNEAGEKKATIESDSIGNIEKNTNTGVHGTTNKNFNYNDMTLLNFKTRDEIRLGDAEIWTCISGNKVEKFSIEITNLQKQNSKDIKGITFIVTDKNLNNKTGGIVQGMSGSPIVQDNKIIGAVTHVTLNNSKKGYGIYLEFMLEDMGIYITD